MVFMKKNNILIIFLIFLFSLTCSDEIHNAVQNGVIEEMKPDELKSEKNFDPDKDPAVCIHYLGHASFVFEFDNGVTVLTDYGKSNSYGLDSPIFGLGEFNPDIATYSHQHEDHAGGEVPLKITHVLKDGETLNYKGVNITSIPTFERSLEKPDNFSYLFTYKGLKILHLGDCQGLITSIQKEEIKDRIKEMYPNHYDVVLLPIGYVNDIVDLASEFAALIRMNTIVPIHYWSQEEKDRFLSIMQNKRGAEGNAYEIVESGSPQLYLYRSGSERLFKRVVALKAAPFSKN